VIWIFESQQGTLTKVWAPRGTRPTAVKQTKYEWVYLYGAVEPATGESTALLAPYVNTPTMNVFLRMLSDDVRERGPDDVALVDKGKKFKSDLIAMLRRFEIIPEGPDVA